MQGRLWWLHLPLSSMNRQHAVTLYEILACMHDCRVLYAYFMNIYDHNNGWLHIKVELFQCRVAVVTATLHWNLICIYSKDVDTEWIISIPEDVRIDLGAEIYNSMIILFQTHRIRIKY